MMILAAAVAAAILGALGPVALSRLPEPVEPDEHKRTYDDLASTPGLSLWLGLTAAVLAGLVASRIEPVSLIPVWVVICGFGVLLAFIDWHTKLLPFLLVIPLNALVLLLVMLAALIERDWSILTGALLAAVVVYAFFWLCNFLIPAAIGFGDVRLSFGLALALGTISAGAVVFGLWVGFALGVICGVVLRLLRVLHGNEIAFGPYLIAGALVGAACGTSVLNTIY